jgi:hypothetical protein
MLKSDASMIMQVLFVLVLIMMMVYLIYTRLAEPTIETYGDTQAKIIAQSVATHIDALSTVDIGSVEKTLKGNWDVQIYLKNNRKCKSPSEEDCGYYIKVSHLKFSAEVVVHTPNEIEEARLSNTNSIVITKNLEGLIKVEKIMS